MKKWKATRCKRRCPVCHAYYVLGETGIKGRCDRCAGVKRDEFGCAYLPGEPGWMDMKRQDEALITLAQSIGNFHALGIALEHGWEIVTETVARLREMEGK